MTETDATKIIEDFMLLANETVAEEYFWREVPFYTVPTNSRMRKRSGKLGTLSIISATISITRNEVRPKEIQQLLGKVEGTPEEPLISRSHCGP